MCISRLAVEEVHLMMIIQAATLYIIMMLCRLLEQLLHPYLSINTVSILYCRQGPTINCLLITLLLAFCCSLANNSEWMITERVNVINYKAQGKKENTLPLAIRNLGMRSTFQSLPLSYWAGGAPMLNLV